MARKRVTPRDKKTSSKPKVYQQQSFKLGMVNDVPSTEVPTTAVHYMYNTISRGGYVENRPGTRLWSNPDSEYQSNPVPYYFGPFHVTEVEALPTGHRRWYKPDNDPFTEDVIGDVIWFEVDGVKHSEVVTSIDSVDPHNLYTQITNVVEVPDNINVYLARQVTAMIYETRYDKIVVVAGEHIYVSNDKYGTLWKEAVFLGKDEDAINKGKTTLAIKNGDVFVFNGNGLYKLYIEKAQELYFVKLNTEVPQVPIEDHAADSVNPEMPESDQRKYGRKRSYTMVRLEQAGDAQRNELDSPPLWESGGTSTQNSKERDFGVYWSVEPISPDNPHQVGLLVPPADTHNATHYGVYGTFNIERQEGIKEEGNNPEELIWELDIPITEPATFQVTVVDPHVLGAGTAKLVSGGKFFGVSSDVLFTAVPKATASFEQPTERYKIPIRPVPTGDEYRIEKQNATAPLGVGDIIEVVSGAASTASATRSSGTTFSIYVPSWTYGGDALTKGTLVYLKDGYGIVQRDKSPHSYALEVKWVKTPNMSVGETGTLAWSPMPRPFVSTVTDTELMARQEVRPMITRFWTPIPNSNIGTVLGNFVICGNEGGTTVHYSQLLRGFEYLAGQHHSAFQFDELDDGLSEITPFKNGASIRCKNSTNFMDTSKPSRTGNPIAGRFISLIQFNKEVSKNIGSVGIGSSAKVFGSDKEMVITSEPALRLFDGTAYGENLVAGSMNNQLRLLRGEYSSVYVPGLGFVLFGKE